MTLLRQNITRIVPSPPIFRYMLLQEFTSTEADGGPSPLAPACNPAASTVAKVYPVKQVTVACAFFAPFFTSAAQLMPAGAWDVLPYRCCCAVTGCCACVWLTPWLTCRL